MTSHVYPYEKVTEEIHLTASTSTKRTQPNLLRWYIRIVLLLVGILSLLRFADLRSKPNGFFRKCHNDMTTDHDDGHHHHHTPTDDWEPFTGPAHFAFEPTRASGLRVRGPRAFGKVIFEISDVTNEVTIDLDIKTERKGASNQVVIEVDGGFITVVTPDTGNLRTYASGKIQIPQSIVGVSSLPTFEVDLPQHMVDFSSLPQSLDIEKFAVRVANGFIKTGPVHTDTTRLSVANGAIKGELSHARQSTNIEAAHGDIVLDISRIALSKSETAITHIHIGNGSLKGNFTVHASTTLDVASGSIDATINFASSDTRAQLSTKTAQGDVHVTINSIATNRTFDARHDSVAGNQVITYPGDFQGTIEARDLLGKINLAGKDLAVENVFGGATGRKGDSSRNEISVNAVTGNLDILVGK